MEQYVHTLIPVASEFVPKPLQVADFVEGLVTTCGLNLQSTSAFKPGLRVGKPSGSFRSSTDPWTGEKKQVPSYAVVEIEIASEIPAVIDGSEEYVVFASGEWRTENQPLVLLTTDGDPFEGSYLCDVSCQLKPKLISTSCVVEDAAFEHNAPFFGEACGPTNEAGIFSHPWSGERIEVPSAGCTRFWIEFEFGKFLLPQMAGTLDVLSPRILSHAKQCFETEFVQGWHYN